MMKKILCMALIIITFSNLSIAVNAEEKMQFNVNGRNISMEEIAEKARLDVNELEKFYMESPEEFLEEVDELYSEKISRASGRNTSGKSVNDFAALVELGKKGDILISATNSRDLIVTDFRHGHAALVYSNTHVVQAVGKGIESMKGELDLFGQMEMVRIYKVSSASSRTAAAAVDYAERFLTGKEYDMDATAGSKTKLNCATLVWQAYKSQGISLKKYFYTVTPQSLVEDSKTDAIGNLNWPGDQDSFDM